MTDIEVIARAIYDKWPDGGETRVPSTAGGYDKIFVADKWEDVRDERRQELLDLGKEVLARFNAAGLVVVPKEPTAKQIEAFYRAAEMPIDPDDFTPVVTKAFKALIGAGK